MLKVGNTAACQMTKYLQGALFRIGDLYLEFLHAGRLVLMAYGTLNHYLQQVVCSIVVHCIE